MKTHAVLLSIVLLCGCSRESGTTHAGDSSKSSTYPHSTTTTPPSSASGHTTDTTSSHTADSTSSHAADTTAKGETDADRHLVEQVRKALAANPDAASSEADIQVSAQSGTVTLRGQVASTDVKSAIESLVKTVPGVQKVNDELTVKSG